MHVMNLMKNFVLSVMTLYVIYITVSYTKEHFSNNIVLTYGFDDESYIDPLASDNLVLALAKAAYDKKIKGVAIRYQNNNIQGIAMQNHDLKAAFELLRKNGKFVEIYTTSLNNIKEMYIFSSASKIILSQEGMSPIAGVNLYLQFQKESLDNLGVKIEQIRTGDFKTDAADTRNTISPEYKEGLQQLLQSYSNILSTAVEHDLQIADIKSVLKILSNTQLSNKSTKITTASFIQWSKQYKKNARNLVKYAFDMQYANSYSKNKIAIVNVQGTISSQSYLATTAFFNKITKITKDKSIKAVLLRVDSGGGAVDLSYELHALMKNLSSQKLAVTSVKHICASGAYVIALSTDKIFAPKTSIVGSIGVIMNHTYQKIPGVNIEQIKSHENDGEMSQYFPFTDIQKKDVVLVIQEMFKNFAKLVQDNRKFTPEYTKQISKGQIFTGLDAKRLKLVDENLDLLGTIAYIKNRLNNQNLQVQFINH